MTFNLQNIINTATAGKSGPMSVVPTTPVAPQPVVSTAPAPVANTFQADRLSQNTVSVPPPVRTNTANTQLGSTVASAITPREQIMNRMTEISDIQRTQGDVTAQNMEEQDVYEKQQKVTDLKNQYDAKDRYYEKKRRELEKNKEGVFGGALQANLDNLDRQKNQELADIAIQYNAAQGNYKTAYDIATAKTDALFEPLKDEIESLKTQYSFIQNDLTESEKIEAQAEIDRQEAELSFMRSKELAQYENLLKQSDPLYQAQLVNERNKKTGIDAPTVKTINGVDMQWNTTTGQWEPVTSTLGTSDPKNTLDQLTFLNSTVDSALSLKGASGPSNIGRFLGDTFVGDTKFRQLEAYTNTLRTNVLTLMTDPSVKKFFGPQMSNADVKLMTAAGTTLNPENQTPTQMAEELGRLKDLFNRMQSAVEKGSQQGLKSGDTGALSSGITYTIK